MNLSDAITIVIPTYNRPKYLMRALDYWGQTEFEIIVTDGSQQKFAGKIPQNVSYYFYPQVSMIQRYFTALEKVKNPYVVFCGDDDFILVRGLFACIDFLNNHPDYASVQGHAIEFGVHGEKRITALPTNVNAIGHHIDGPTAVERLNQLFDEYIYQVYSVYRTPMIQLALETCRYQKNRSYFELLATIIPSIFGKHKVLPVFYSARESIPGSGRGPFAEVLRFDILKPDGLLEYEQCRDKVAHVYSDAEGVSLDVALAIVEDTFAKYNAWDLRTFPNRRPKDAPDDPTPTSFSAKDLLKRIIPPPLLKARLKVLTKLGYRKEEDLHPNLRSLPNLPGFPWSDPSAAKDWKRLVDLIMKYEE